MKVGKTTVPGNLIQSSTPTQLIFKVPLGAVPSKITVTTVDGTGTSPNILAVGQGPRANVFRPNPASVGTTVTITGTNLQQVMQVTFGGGVTAVPFGQTATSLQVQVPPDALMGPVSLTDLGNTVTSTAILKIAPKITDFTPGTAVGGSGDLVTVNGTNLRAATGKGWWTSRLLGLVHEGLVEANDAAGDLGKRIFEGGGGSDPDRVWHRPVQGGH